MQQLQHEYPGIGTPRSATLGGNQRWMKSQVLQRCGCGVVAALDLIRYLHLYRDGFRTDFFTGIPESRALPRPVYDLCAQRMRLYVPVLPPVGTSGIALAAGLNRYFRRYSLPLTARWGVPRAQLWEEIGAMLADDLPVILSIGNSFPRLWQRGGAALYRRSADDSMCETAHIQAHFVTVVGIDAQWLRISSWGREYYLSKDEYLSYCRQHSLDLLCSIVRIYPRQV